MSLVLCYHNYNGHGPLPVYDYVIAAWHSFKFVF